MAMIGQAIKLYFDELGNLVVTDKPREGLREFSSSSDFTIDAPLDGVVEARVRMAIGAVDLTIPPEQVKIMLDSEEVDHDMLLTMRAELMKRREGLMMMRRKVATHGR